MADKRDKKREQTEMIPYKKSDLYKHASERTQGESLQMVAMPMGGIGTGMRIAGRAGELRDWEDLPAGRAREGSGSPSCSSGRGSRARSP